MHPRLQDDRYLAKLAEYLNGTGVPPLAADPFALACPYEYAYVERADVERQLQQQVSQFVFGRFGSGKSTLFGILRRSAPRHGGEQRLVVPISLLQPQRFLSVDTMRRGNQSVLGFSPLMRAVFDALWNDLVVDPIHAKLQLRDLRLSKAWMRKFRQYYQSLPPADVPEPADKALLRSLKRTGRSTQVKVEQQPEAVLTNLLHFVSHSHEYMLPTTEAAGIPWRYSMVEVLVDGAETLSTRGLEKLLSDADDVCALYHADNLIVKLFLEKASNYEAEVRRRNSVQHGLAQIVHLPAWTKEELLSLIGQRLRAASANQYSDLRHLAHNLPREAIKGELRYNLAETIAQGAMQIYSNGVNTRQDAPVHMLQITSEVMAAMAGCRQEQYEPPLGTNQIVAIIHEYWQKAVL
jgi:hypothetical protein